MTGFDLFKDSSSLDFDSFQCFQCDIKLFDAADALCHLKGHLPDEKDDEDHDDSDDQINSDDQNNFDPTYSNPQQANILNQNLEQDQNNADSGFLSGVDSGIKHDQSSQQARLEWTGEAKCPKCSEVFHSKIAWTYHCNHAHQNDADNELARFVRNNKDFEPFDLVMISMNDSNQINNDKNDDIPVSTNGEIKGNIDIASSSQIDFDKYDDIPVSSQDEILSDPPSPVISSSNCIRARCTDSEDYSRNEGNIALKNTPDEKLSNDAIAELYIAESLLLLTEDGSLADGIEVKKDAEVKEVNQDEENKEINSSKTKNPRKVSWY